VTYVSFFFFKQKATRISRIQILRPDQLQQIHTVTLKRILSLSQKESGSVVVCVFIWLFVEMNEALLANNVKASVRASQEERGPEGEGQEQESAEAGGEIRNFPIGKHTQHGVKEFALTVFRLLT